MIDLYLNTAVKFIGIDGKTWITTPGIENHGAILPKLLFPNCSEVWIITAQNPKSEGSFIGDAGQVLMNSLKEDLIEGNFEFTPVECGSPDWKHVEDSYAVSITNLEGAAQIQFLAKKYQQNAVFRFHSDKQEVVSTIGESFSGETLYSLNEFKEA